MSTRLKLRLTIVPLRLLLGQLQELRAPLMTHISNSFISDEISPNTEALLSGYSKNNTRRVF